MRLNERPGKALPLRAGPAIGESLPRDVPGTPAEANFRAFQRRAEPPDCSHLWLRLAKPCWYHSSALPGAFLRRLVAAQRTYSGVQVRNSIAFGRRVAVRTTLLQIGVTGVVALIASMFGSRIGLATLAGGAIIAVGNWLFAMRLFGRGVAPARDVLRSAYLAEVLKWFWLCLALYLAIAIFKMPFAGLIAGVLAAQFSFWIALVAIR